MKTLETHESSYFSTYFALNLVLKDENLPKRTALIKNERTEDTPDPPLTILCSKSSKCLPF